MSKLTLDINKLSRELSPLVRRSRQPTGSTLSLTTLPTNTGSLDAASSSASAAVAQEINFATLIKNGISLENTRYKLRDYQAVGVQFLQTHKRRFLTDKPGLGKTLQAILAAKLPVIIFCPTYLTYNWYNVLQELAIPAEHSVVQAVGPRAARQAAINQRADWTICNIEMLREYEFSSYATLIIDEAHHVRGKDSKQSLGAMKLSLAAEYVFLLTATPVYNRPDDLYAQFRLLDHDAFHSYWRFVDTHCKSIQMPFGPKIVGARPSLRVLFEKYNLGRTYADVSMQLPDLVSDVIRIEPPDDFKKLYADLKYRYFVPGKEIYENALEVLQALRKITGPQKLKPLLSLLTDTDALTGTVIFSWYRETAEQVAELLGIPCVTGEMPPKERLRVAKSAQCISATISSMAEGVDLSHLHTVVFFELDYVPGRLYQALSRVRRHGGADIVKVYYLLVKNTVDEVLYNVDTARTQTINEIVREALS